MWKRQGAGHYFPGKDFGSLSAALKHAFGDVTDGDVTDPDRNCYIEVKVEPDWGIPGKWLTEYVDKVNDLHEYALRKTNYHLDGGEHPLYSAQLTGIRDWIGPGTGPGVTLPFPHSWLRVPYFATHRFWLTTPVTDAFPNLKPGMTFSVEMRSAGNHRAKAVFVIRDFDGVPGISVSDLYESLSRIVAVEGDRSLVNQIRVRMNRRNPVVFRLEEPGQPPRYVGWHYVGLGFPAGFRVKMEAEPPRQPGGPSKQETETALKNLGYPVGQWYDKELHKNRVAVHEVGHNFFNAGRIKCSAGWTRSLEKAYHLEQNSYREPSLSTDLGFSSWRFSPLIAREYRCSIFSYFESDGTGFGD